MGKQITSFLIQCDKQAMITGTYWYQPAFLISPYQTMLKDLFVQADQDRVKALLNMAFGQVDVIRCRDHFQLVGPKVKIALCVLAAGEKALVYGFDANMFAAQGDFETAQEVAHRFMRVIRAADADLMTRNEMMIREHFEQIQLLNNSLLNMQRELKKTHAKLRQANQELSNRLVKDPLTGLVSRYQYRGEIETVIQKAPEKLGVFTFIDIDGFKKINDTFGHRAGDQFLSEFAKRLMRLDFQNLICMRISGDEFGLYSHGYESVVAGDIQRVWDSISATVLTAPIMIGAVAQKVFCCAGMAVYGRDTRDVFDLIEYADFAMYEAKRAGKNSYREFHLMRYNGKKQVDNPPVLPGGACQ